MITRKVQDLLSLTLGTRRKALLILVSSSRTHNSSQCNAQRTELKILPSHKEHTFAQRISSTWKVSERSCKFSECLVRSRKSHPIISSMRNQNFNEDGLQGSVILLIGKDHIIWLTHNTTLPAQELRQPYWRGTSV